MKQGKVRLRFSLKRLRISKWFAILAKLSTFAFNMSYIFCKLFHLGSLNTPLLNFSLYDWFAHSSFNIAKVWSGVAL